MMTLIFEMRTKYRLIILLIIASLAMVLLYHSDWIDRKRIYWTALHSDLTADNCLLGVWQWIMCDADLHTSWLESVAKNHGNKWARSKALKVLASNYRTTSKEILAHALSNDPSYDVRATVAEAIGKTGDSSFITNLFECLRTDTHYYPRCRAAGSLGVLGERNITAQLIAAYTNEQNITVKTYIIGALAVGGPAATDTLIDVLCNNTNVLVRHHAAFVLYRIGDPKSLDALQYATKNDVDTVTMWTTRAIKKIEKSIQQDRSTMPTPIDEGGRGL
jgi:HEAT repeats